MQQLQLLLTDYLDIQNMAGDPQQAPTSFSESTSDILVYFARRRPPRQKRTPLFKFDYSSHALSINSYLKEQRISSAKVGCNMISRSVLWISLKFKEAALKFVDEFHFFPHWITVSPLTSNWNWTLCIKFLKNNSVYVDLLQSSHTNPNTYNFLHILGIYLLKNNIPVFVYTDSSDFDTSGSMLGLLVLSSCFQLHPPYC